MNHLQDKYLVLPVHTRMSVVDARNIVKLINKII